MDYIYCHSISDTNFGIEYKLKSEENSNQAIALYALSGKFQIYYVLDTFEIKKMNENEIAIYPRQIKAYVDDSFDFGDKPMQFVGAWNYAKMEFIVGGSILQGVDKNISKDSDNNMMRNKDFINQRFHIFKGLL